MRIGVFKAERLGGNEPMNGMVAVQVLLAGIGAVVLFSASWYFARTVFGDPFRIWRRQIVWMVLETWHGLKQMLSQTFSTAFSRALYYRLKIHTYPMI